MPRASRLMSPVRRPRSRRHHTVPQFYLRGFADSTERVLQVDVETGRIYDSTVARSAFRNHAYRPERLNVDAERELSDQESRLRWCSAPSAKSGPQPRRSDGRWRVRCSFSSLGIRTGSSSKSAGRGTPCPMLGVRSGRIKTYSCSRTASCSWTPTIQHSADSLRPMVGSIAWRRCSRPSVIAPGHS